MPPTGASVSSSFPINVGEIAIIFANMLGHAMQSDSGIFEEVTHDIKNPEQPHGESGVHL